MSKFSPFFTQTLVFTLCILLLSNLNAYEVYFTGVDNNEALQLLESISKVVELKNEDTPGIALLGKRAETDLPVLIEALHSLGYYDASGEYKLAEDAISITFQIKMGPLFTFGESRIRYSSQDSDLNACPLTSPITLETLGLSCGLPATPEVIISAEDTLLDKLNLQGFAFAKIIQRDVFADETNKQVLVLFVVNLGPETYIGPTKIKGLKRLNESFVLKKIKWEEGSLYSPCKIEKTQEALELSGLFRSVNITLADEPTCDNLMEMEISVLEAKQRSVGVGLNFTTELGPGFTADWEDRNFTGIGDKLSFRTDLWNALQDARVNYQIPDFWDKDQQLNWLVDWHHDRNKSYSETAFSVSAILEKKLTDNLRISYGGMYKILRSMRSVNNGTFDLIKFPLQVRWNKSNSILEPTEGFTLQFKCTPSLQILSPRFAYAINHFTGTLYQPLTANKRHIFAAKLNLGSIIGSSNHDIPPPERFYTGSENSLRGYRFLTVSPLGRHDKPLGGRSLFVYSLEMRSRIGENFGSVLFYDIGNVYKDYLPKFNKGLLQSVGLGIRYYTPIGPIRLDLAFPLNRRRKGGREHGYIDNFMEAYFSIGQAF